MERVSATIKTAGHWRKPGEWWKATPHDLLSASCLSDSNPYKRALFNFESNKWNEALDEGYRLLLENYTWELVRRPANESMVSCKWVYMTKDDT